MFNILSTLLKTSVFFKKVLRLLGECPYKVDGHNFLEKFLQAGDSLTPGMVDYPKMFTEALKCLGVDTKAL